MICELLKQELELTNNRILIDGYEFTVLKIEEVAMQFVTRPDGITAFILKV